MRCGARKVRGPKAQLVGRSIGKVWMFLAFRSPRSLPSGSGIEGKEREREQQLP